MTPDIDAEFRAMMLAIDWHDEPHSQISDRTSRLALWAFISLNLSAAVCAVAIAPTFRQDAVGLFRDAVRYVRGATLDDAVIWTVGAAMLIALTVILPKGDQR